MKNTIAVTHYNFTSGRTLCIIPPTPPCAYRYSSSTSRTYLRVSLHNSEWSRTALPGRGNKLVIYWSTRGRRITCKYAEASYLYQIFLRHTVWVVYSVFRLRAEEVENMTTKGSFKDYHSGAACSSKSPTDAPCV